MRLKHHLVCGLFFISTFTEAVSAEVLHWPELCRTGVINIKNSGTAKASLWLQKFNPNLANETEYEIPATSEISFTVEKLENEHYSLLHFSPDKKIEVSYECGKTTYMATTLEGGMLTFPQSSMSKVWLQNLFSGENTVEIEYQNLAFQKVASTTLTLHPLTSVTFPVRPDVHDWQYLKISSSNRLSSFPLNEAGNILPVLVQPQQTFVADDGSYFLVAARDGNSDSFVVKISDAKMVSRARDLVKNPQKEKMLFASIQKDHQGFNRNFSSSQKNLWSWSTKEVTNFADLGSIACNGQPQVLEDRVDSWLEDPGQICFWNYRVKKELSPLEVATGKLR